MERGQKNYCFILPRILLAAVKKAIEITTTRESGAGEQKTRVEKMAVAQGARLDHIARESSDVARLASFYKEVFGFEETEAPKFADFKVIWLNLPQSFTLHLIERNHSFRLPEGPYSATSAVLDPAHITRGHHISFSVPNFDSFVQVLQEKGIESCLRTRPDGKVRQVFFFDPDGNGLEVASRDE